MIIQIHSKNKYLLDILHKNPHTDWGLYAKSLRNGQVIGLAVSPNQYDVVFQDTKYSYLPEKSNQIDFQSYCSPLVILHICNELFRNQLKDKEIYFSEEIKWLNQSRELIDNQACEIKIPNLYINSNWYANGRFLLEKYFKNIKTETLVGNNVSVTIKARSVFEALNLLNLLAVFAHITNHYGISTYIDDNFAQKYARVLTNIENVPYFLFYLFIRRVIKSERQFEEVRPVFEQYFKVQGTDIQLNYRNNQECRVDFVLGQIDRDTAVLDVGCGEFHYYKRLMSKKFDSTYFAIDIDEKVAEFYPKMRKRYPENNLVFYTDWSHFSYQKPVNIFLSEVIEHNTVEEAKELVKKCLRLNFNKIIITTPNSEFNSFYFDENEESLRHDDHKFEFDSTEFKRFIQSCLSSNETAKFCGVGDCINGIQPTQAVVIQKKTKI